MFSLDSFMTFPLLVTCGSFILHSCVCAHVCACVCLEPFGIYSLIKSVLDVCASLNFQERSKGEGRDSRRTLSVKDTWGQVREANARKRWLPLSGETQLGVHLSEVRRPDWPERRFLNTPSEEGHFCFPSSTIKAPPPWVWPPHTPALGCPSPRGADK